MRWRRAANAQWVDGASRRRRAAEEGVAPPPRNTAALAPQGEKYWRRAANAQHGRARAAGGRVELASRRHRANGIGTEIRRWRRLRDGIVVETREDVVLTDC